MERDGHVGTTDGDDPVQADPFSRERATELLGTARNAIETAGLLELRSRSGDATGPAARGGDEAGSDETDDEIERDERHTTGMTEEREELLAARDRIDDELAALGAAIEDLQVELAAIDDDVAAAVSARNTATEAFLPADRLPQSISNDTRDAVASYLDTLAEKRDVRSEQVAKKTAEQDVERKCAGDARDDVDEIGAVIERLVERTGESKSRVATAREQLDAARSQFTDDLAALARQFETFDVGLSEGTLDAVIDERIPARNASLLASIESVSRRVAELSTETATLEDDRDKLESIEGGGTCPTCNQNVGPERTGSEVEAIETELHQAERELGAAKQERDELISRRDELSDLREEAIALRTFRSETVAGAADRLEDRQGEHEVLEVDLEEARSEQAELKEERDEADVEITVLDTEIDSIEAQIDRLRVKTENGERCLEAFDVVDELRAQLEGRVDELSDVQEAYEEKEVERAALDAEIENLPE